MKEPRPWSPLIPPEQLPQHAGKATLVLDLNKTLVAWATSLAEKYDFICEQRGEGSLLVRKRPHLDEFLQRMSELFELVVFTTGLEHLASKVLDELDPKRDLFAYRLYADSCSLHPEYKLVKDLSMLGRGMERVMILDDTAQKAVLNIDNWIPVLPFHDDPNDRELLHLIPLLETVSKLDDVRPALREYQRSWIRRQPKRLKQT